MSKCHPIFTFVAGMVTGAALLILANTEKGEQVIDDLKEKGDRAFENGRSAILNGLDKIEKALVREEDKRADDWDEARQEETSAA